MGLVPLASKKIPPDKENTENVAVNFERKYWNICILLYSTTRITFEISNGMLNGYFLAFIVLVSLVYV